MKDYYNLVWRGSTESIVKEELEAKLKKNTPLRVKYGIDPTGPRIHIGHASVMRKLQYLQKMGHTIVLIVGDFTAQIGDTSDKESERGVISMDQIKENVESFQKQLGHIFDFSKAEIHYNSTWFNTMNLGDFLELSQLFSVAQMLERDNFSKRYEDNKRIGLQEFLYPVLQGYDSVAVNADIEIGGNDQLFNILAGRTVQKYFRQPQQNVILYELLLGTDGRKMSKTWQNAVWIDDAPNDMFGKLMTVGDELIYDYFRLCTDLSDEDLRVIKEKLDATDNPRDIKAQMAKELVAIYNDADSAESAEKAFNKQFQDGALPDDIDDVVVNVSTWKIADLLVEIGLAESKSKAKRAFDQGGVRINQVVVKTEEVKISNNDVIQVGKRNFRKLQLILR